MQTLFSNARIIDATDSESREGHVLVEDGVIRDLSARAVGAPDRPVLDLKGPHPDAGSDRRYTIRA